MAYGDCREVLPMVTADACLTDPKGDPGGKRTWMASNVASRTGHSGRPSIYTTARWSI